MPNRIATAAGRRRRTFCGPGTDPAGASARSLPSLLALALALALGPAPGAAAEDPDADWLGALRERVRPSAEAQAEWAWGTAVDRAQKLELTLRPEVEIDLPWDVRFTAIGRARADAYDRLEDGVPQQKERTDASRRYFTGSHVSFELREAYFETTIGSAYVVLGKQQIVWGQSDGLKVLDIVNPQSFREFILEDFDESRIPLWSANIEVPIGDVTFQAVWIPDRTYHDLVGDKGGLYRFKAPRFVGEAPPPGVGSRVRGAERPSHFFRGSDAGFRIKGFFAGWDFSFNYLYHYFDFPTLYTSIEVENGQPTAVVTPEYKRTHLVGGTFSNAFGDLTVRGEVAFQNDRYFTARIPNQSDGVGQTEEIVYVLGFDWYGIRDSLLSLQFFQSILGGDPPGVFRDRVETTFTLFGQHRMLNDTLLLEAIWLTTVNETDGLLRPKVVWQPRDAIKLWAGFDWFYGSRNGAFGQFDSRDRLVVGFEVAI